MLISVDEAYAFDYLSILYVKKGLNKETNKTYLGCKKFLKNQLSNEKWDLIIKSEEYKNLIKTNQELFNAVEDARYGIISSKQLDNKNMERYYAKQKFQKKLFPGKKIKEVKT
jgi:protein-arginine kinase